MSPSKWGPPIWRFIHCFVENIREEQFRTLGPDVFSLIKQICKTLPCPLCSTHAGQFLSSVRFQHINNKNDLIYLLYVFHNTVRKRKKQSIFNDNDLIQYKKYNLFKCFNDFINAYKTQGNMKLMADNFSRDITIRQIKQFLVKNKNNFTGPSKVLPFISRETVPPPHQPVSENEEKDENQNEEKDQNENEDKDENENEDKDENENEEKGEDENEES
jgi:hypothetical protein